MNLSAVNELLLYPVLGHYAHHTALLQLVFSQQLFVMDCQASLYTVHQGERVELFVKGSKLLVMMIAPSPLYLLVLGVVEFLHYATVNQGVYFFQI